MACFSAESLGCVRGENHVFHGLRFSLMSGGALVLVGANGSGKSSLLRMMAGLLRPYTGMLAWDGEDVREDIDAHNARFHYVGHHDAVKSVLSVAENIRFWAALRGGKDSDFDRALAVMDIAHLIDAPGRFLSAGQRRRVNLARIIAAPAPLWLLDEPTTALDKASIGRLERAIEAHRAAGGMVVLSTHSDIDLPRAEVLNLGDFAPRADAFAEMFGDIFDDATFDGTRDVCARDVPRAAPRKTGGAS